MTYKVLRYPEAVYPGEVQAECPEAMAQIDVLIRAMQRQGPAPAGFAIKALGQKMDGLWQVNMKVEKRQVRILFVPYGSDIVWFRIHKKSSPQEQQRAYALARRRKRDYENAQKQQKAQSNDQRPKLNGRTGPRH
jgi:hypothetical protein